MADKSFNSANKKRTRWSPKVVQSLLWLIDTPKTEESEPVARKPDRKMSRRDRKLFNLAFAHALGAKRFGDDSRQYARSFLKSLPQYPALSSLDGAAKVVASTYLFQAHMAHRLRAAGKYWLLDGIGPQYPFPIAVRTGYFPRWKRPARTLERLLADLEEIIGEASKLESGLAPSHPESMPCTLISDAAMKLYQAVDWMRAFPSPTTLRSKYRKALRPDIESESAEVLAYVLDRLFRQRSTPRLKIKDIECRIAEIENYFLGQNVTAHSDFGCPAVREQIRKVKSWKTAKAVDCELKENLKSTDDLHRRFREARELGSAEFKKRLERSCALLDEFGKHMQGYQAWTGNTQAALKADLGKRLVGPMSADELLNILKDYHAKLDRHLSETQGWHSELNQHMEATRALNEEFDERVQGASLWMAECERAWKLQP